MDTLIQGFSDEVEQTPAAVSDIDADFPAMSSWQELVAQHDELDALSGACWHRGARQKHPVPIKPSLNDHMKLLQRTLASWFVQSDSKYIPTWNKEMRLGKAEVQKLVPQMLAERFPDDDLALKHVNKLIEAALFGASPDPRLAFGVYSGKAYPQPGNTSQRLFRNGMWDINTWQKPAYRDLPQSGADENQSNSFYAMLEFAIPRQDERAMLLDWIAWNLQNEGNKPNWAIMLYSESKGTGKSTIAKVLTALFGQENTALANGIKPLTQQFAADVLDRKLIVAEEVHISSHSADGNALKDLITNSVVSVERKYQPIVTIPQTSCFLFMTNHKPLWLEGGERRYYIIDMDHEGHAQGARNDEFVALAGKVNEQVNNPQYVRDLYEGLIVRKLSDNFDPKNMRFGQNATQIMQELQANSGNETEAVLKALLEEYNVAMLPGSELPVLVSHLRLRNLNSLRNMLSRLGFETRRVRHSKAQHRVWCKKHLEIENGRVSHTDLAERQFGAIAPLNGYTWFDIAYSLKVTWDALLEGKLGKRPKEDYSAISTSARENSNGEYGPFKDSTTHLSLQARTKDELVVTDIVPTAIDDSEIQF